MCNKIIKAMCLGLMCQLLFIGSLAAQDSSSLPDVAGLYLTTVTDETGQAENFSDEWRMWRNGDIVEVQKEQLLTQEQWDRSAPGRIYYRWSSHPNEFSILHVSTDLPAPGVNYDWDARAMIVNQEVLLLLDKDADSEVLGHRAENYSGTVDEVEVTLTWLVDLQILAKVVQTFEGTETAMLLLEVYSLADAPWQPVSTDAYRELDYVDLADHEADPLVNRYMKMRGGHADDH